MLQSCLRAACLPTKPLKISSHAPGAISTWRRVLSSVSGEEILNDFVNHEASGVPRDAGIDGPSGFDLGRMHQVLDALGSPQQGLPVVHVAGTKGKGSVVSMLSAILQQAGYSVGTYTSPHLVTLRERLQVDAAPITPGQFDELVSAAVQASKRVAASPLSHFELMTAMALKWFKQQKVDVAIVEAGLGGARDATNVFEPEQLKAAIITAVGLEHQEALGGSLESIAAAKAGIMKRGRPLVLGRQPHSEAKQVLCKQAVELGCRRYEGQAMIWPQQLNLGRQSVTEDCKIILLNGECSSAVDLKMGLIGEHQRDNAVTAASAALVLRQQGFDRITVPAIVEGLSKARIPGRFQVGRFRGSNSEHWLVLDGAHTAASAAALTATLRHVFPEDKHPLALVIAMAADKDLPAVMSELRASRPQVVAFTTVPIAGSTARAAPPGMLAAHWQAAGMAQARPARSRELIQASLTAAIEKAQAELGMADNGVICVTGSMHAVGEALKQDVVPRDN